LLPGLFSVTNPIKGAKVEEEQGKAMTQAAMQAGVQHIGTSRIISIDIRSRHPLIRPVFTATDRGSQSETDPTPIPHFASKFNIESDIVEKTKASGASWTFLRPTAFYENLTNDFLGKGFMAMWKLNGSNSKLQLVSTKDIGKVAADAFLNASSEEYCNRSIALAGDEISFEEAAKTFKETTGQNVPLTNSFIGRALRFSLREQLGIMFDWFASDGFKVDVSDTKRRYPFMKDFRAWLEEESAWKKS
jgi:uncharacterized protein YbjT (DUF2867 family)